MHCWRRAGARCRPTCRWKHRGRGGVAGRCRWDCAFCPCCRPVAGFNLHASLGAAHTFRSTLPCPAIQEKHARLAAALCLNELTQERDIQGVVAKWGREGFVSKGGWVQLWKSGQCCSLWAAGAPPWQLCDACS